jgi:ABC-type phosphate transport system substrate-binding protein
LRTGRAAQPLAAGRDFHPFTTMLRKLGFYLLAGLSCAAGAPAQTLQVAGSDLLQVAVGEPLADYVRKNGLDVKVDFYGTVPAMTALKQDKVQLAVIAAPVGEQPSAKDFAVVPYAYQVAYILVNGNNPITEVDRDDLIGVFGTGQATDISQWSQLGLAGEWESRSVLAATTSNDDGVVLELFKHTILGGTALKPSVQVLASGSDLAKMVGDNENIIAVGRYVPDGAKALYVSFEHATTATADEGGSKVSFAPTEENIYNGDYPLRLPFYIVYKAENQAKVRQLLQVLLSEEFAGHLKDQHFMPVPDTERKRSLLELDNAK